MFRVEFIGLPGAGKTTIQKKLVQHLQLVDKDKYLGIEDAFILVSKVNIDKFYRLILKSLPDVIALKLSIRLINRSLMQFEAQSRFLAKWGKSFETFLSSKEYSSLSIDERKIVISGFFQTGALFECINGQLPEKTVVFFEEGFLQKSFMFISRQTNKYADKAKLYIYLDHIPLPDLIIYLKSDLETCFERMVARPQGVTDRLQSADKNVILNFLEISHAHLENVASWIQKNKNIVIFEINNDQKLENVIGSLENRVRAFFETNFFKKSIKNREIAAQQKDNSNFRTPDLW